MSTKISLAVLMLSALVIIIQPRPAVAATGVRFEITGSGSLTHFEIVTAGVKPPVTKVTAAQIAACITGVGNGCTVGDNNLENDPGGKAYLYIPDSGGNTSYISTDANCADLTEIEGLGGGTGTFMFAGRHNKSETDFIIQGTATFAKGTTTLTAIKKASILAVSASREHYGVGIFATVGAAVPVSCLP